MYISDRIVIVGRGSILARRTANFADPTCQFWLVFGGSPFRIFKNVRIILRPKFTNLNFRLPTIYINRLGRKKPETLSRMAQHSRLKLKHIKMAVLLYRIKITVYDTKLKICDMIIHWLTCLSRSIFKIFPLNVFMIFNCLIWFSMSFHIFGPI